MASRGVPSGILSLGADSYGLEHHGVRSLYSPIDVHHQTIVLVAHVPVLKGSTSWNFLGGAIAQVWKAILNGVELLKSLTLSARSAAQSQVIHAPSNFGIASYHIHLPNPATKYGPGVEATGPDIRAHQTNINHTTTPKNIHCKSGTDLRANESYFDDFNSLHEELSCTSHEAAFLTLDEPDDWVIVNVNTPERE
ncbi:hypothetical protein RhiXN_11369 [Rhizoctonia solani]|uniref:Uncharacterized protein n=1 Tax=Rhizoctonia solani TaxID=456999 RepID=A0A8H8P529_9AGAM|nr:uncharacterized protein RhiXN_11369 [Rhizoctonia solani]QRW24457.1 hypothetical protein RhiXN_11369 [Rhizoctonia solani]